MEKWVKALHSESEGSCGSNPNPVNHFHNILRFYDALPNFPFTTSKTMCDYYL